MTRDIVKIVKAAQKAYKGTAKIEINGNKLVIRNTVTKAIHPWIDGSNWMTITEREKAKIWAIL